MKILIFGPPGVGKGTQVELLEKYLLFNKISMGDILRNEIKNNTKIGKKILKFQNLGMLVNDNIIINLIKKHLNKNDNVILDGFPRNKNQAIILMKMDVKIDFIFNIYLTKSRLLKRLKYRIIDKKSQKIYNIIYKRPKLKEKDNVTGTNLIRRHDDSYRTVLNRLTIYDKNNDNILDWYNNNSNIKIINIDGSIGKFKIFKLILSEIKYEKKI